MRFQGHFEDAGRCFEEALALHQKAYPSLSSLSGIEKLPEAQIQAMLCCGIGVSWYDRDDCTRARQYYASVEQFLAEVGIVDGPVWAYLLLQYSYIDWHEGRHPEAQTAAQKALQLFEATLRQNHPVEQLPVKTRLRRTLAGDPVDLGRTYLALGLPAGATGQLSATISYLTTSLQIFEHYNCLREIAIVCCNLGDVYLRRAEYSSAEQYLLRALDITTRIGEIALQCFVTGNLGLLALRTDKLSASENWYRRGLKSALQIDEAYSNCLLSTFLAFVLLKQGKFSEIAPCLRRSFSLQRNKNIPDCTALNWIVLGYVRLSQVPEIHSPDTHAKSTGAPAPSGKLKQRLLCARSSVQRALALPGIDIEIRTEAELLQAHISLFLDSLEETLRQATHVLASANKYELKWIGARAELFIKSLQPITISQ